MFPGREATVPGTGRDRTVPSRDRRDGDRGHPIDLAGDSGAIGEVGHLAVSKLILEPDIHRVTGPFGMPSETDGTRLGDTS